MVNAFFLIILIALILRFVLSVVANILNLKALKLELPPALEGVYKPEEYRNSQEYVHTTMRFDSVTGTFALSLLLAFWFTGGFNSFDQLVRGWGYISIVNGLLYIGILLITYELLLLPFDVYATFVIEERFGFNRTAPRTFIMDRIKGLLLAALLGAPLLAGVLALFQYSDSYAWLYCFLGTSLFILIVQFVAPVWIMPLFNKFSPMPDNELKAAILKYANSVGYTINNVFVTDGSKRSSKSNAFFTGFGRNKRIALFDTLIEKHTTPELVAVLAHEIGHYKKRHVVQGMVLSILHMGIIFFLLSVFVGSPGLYQAFRMEQNSVYAGLLFFGLLYTPVEMFLSIAMQVLSRRNEYQADRFAAETIEQPHSLIEALRKLSATNLANLSPHPFYVFLNYSHPPLLQRLKAIQHYETQVFTTEQQTHPGI